MSALLEPHLFGQGAAPGAQTPFSMYVTTQSPPADSTIRTFYENMERVSGRGEGGGARNVSVEWIWERGMCVSGMVVGAWNVCKWNGCGSAECV